MEIDAAVGTTFTLDLTALLTIPVAASFDSVTVDAEPADLLETIRRYADRTILFCQAGAITVPSRYRAAHTFIEDTVIEVRKPAGGVFHPKVWIVRFTGDGLTSHRVLVMSRNLTFDRSWDVIVTFDEDESADRYAETDGLVTFMRALPRMSARELTPSQEHLISALSASLANARLAVPDGFTTASFVPRMEGHRGTPFLNRCDACLAISPFLAGDAIASFFSPKASRKALVSRRAALDAQASHIESVPEIYRVKDLLLSAEDDVNALTDDRGDDSDPGPRAEPAGLRGIHAKVYVQDHGRRATAWLGSANLTGAAFARNVELLVELTGRRDEMGVDSVLSGGGDKNGLSWIVEEHSLPDEDGPDDPEEGVDEIQRYGYDLASRVLHLTCLPSTVDGNNWTALLSVEGWDIEADITVAARPLSLRVDRAVNLVAGRAEWSGLTVEEITPFVVLTTRAQGRHHSVLVRAEISGDPSQRRRSVIANAIRSRDDFLRYLSALLGAMVGGGLPPAGADGAGYDSWIEGIRMDRVLEDLLTTASRSPRRLESLDHTLSVLQADQRFTAIVPDDFMQLWSAVYAARKSAIS